MKRTILYAGGVVNLLLAVGHMFFWKMLNWSEELPKLSRDNQGIMQTANVIMIFMMLYFAAMSFIIARHRVLDIFAKSIILCITGLYSIRLFLGYPFFGFSLEELVIWIVCLMIVIGYLSVLFIKSDHK